MIKALRIGKQRKSIPKIFGFDCETYSKKNHFFCCALYGDDFQKTYFDKEEFKRDIKTKRFRSAWIVATNLGFDFDCMFFGSEEAKNIKRGTRGSSLYLAEVRFKQNHDKEYNVKFIGTENYIIGSVEKLGHLIGVPKLEHPKFLGSKPKNKEELNELVIYNMRDAEVSQKVTKFLLKAFHDLGATCKTTMAQTALSLFKNKYLDRTYFAHSKDILKDIFKAYHGGRTECFKRGRVEDAYYYDVNSLYPSCMLNEMPDPNTLHKTEASSIELIKKFHGISNVVIIAPEHMNIPLLPFLTDKLIFPLGILEGWYTHIELRKALELGYVIEEIKYTYYYTNICHPFNDYVNDLYTLRNKYKSENNKGMSEACKLLMNSLYGKFGQKFDERDVMIHKENETADFCKYDCVEPRGDYMRCVTLDGEPSNFCMPIWSVYVSSYARLLIFEYLSKYDPIYCDTDSLVTTQKIPVSDRLGEMKLESEIKFGIFVRPKMYCFTDINGLKELKLKGVPKKLVFDFRDIYEKEIPFEKFVKFKEALIRGLLPNEIINTSKLISFEDTKRVWNRKFSFVELQDSEPIVNI